MIQTYLVQEKKIAKKAVIIGGACINICKNKKKFDVNFLTDTVEISAGQVSRINNTWILFLSEELSFLVPWHSQLDIKKKYTLAVQDIPNSANY